MLGTNIGIDLGTTSILIFIEGNPLTYSPSFQKSIAKIGFVLRNIRTCSYMNFRCSEVTINSGTASLPTGI